MPDHLNQNFQDPQALIKIVDIPLAIPTCSGIYVPQLYPWKSRFANESCLGRLMKKYDPLRNHWELPDSTNRFHGAGRPAKNNGCITLVFDIGHFGPAVF